MEYTNDKANRTLESVIDVNQYIVVKGIHHSVEGKAAYLIWLKKEINKARNLSVIISEKRLKFWMSGAMIKKKITILVILF